MTAPALATSDAERTLLTQITWAKLPGPAVQHRFHPTRKWRFDMAWPERMVAVEVDGGAFVGGRHVTGAGFETDCEKLSEAAAMGWRVLRFTPRMIRDGRALTLLEKALA